MTAEGTKDSKVPGSLNGAGLVVFLVRKASHMRNVKLAIGEANPGDVFNETDAL